MTPKIRVRGALAALVTTFLFLPPAGHAAPAAPTSSPVKLVVVISVDGLGWSRLKGYEPWFQADGGLKRLLNEGMVFTNTNYAHLNTETCPGHASLGTGAPPRIHGIVANRWVMKDPKTGEQRRYYCTDRPDSPAEKPIASAANLRVQTLGDQLVQQSPGSRVVSLSGKDRAAIYLAGHNPDHVVYWFDYRGTGTYITSTEYSPNQDAKNLVEKFNESKAGGNLKNRFQNTWTPLSISAPGDLKPEPNLARFQMVDLGIGFPHQLPDSRYSEWIYGSPFQDELLADLALDFLNSSELALGRKTAPDLMMLSFSAQDVVSHNFGNESEEELDTLRRLDIQLGRVLKALDQRDPGSVALALSADHGFARLPEVARRRAESEDRREDSRTGGRLLSSDYLRTGGINPESPRPNFQERVNRALAGELCLPAQFQAIHSVEGWTLTYDEKAFPAYTAASACCPAGRKVTKTDVDRVLPQVVQELFSEEIEEVLLISQRDHWVLSDPAVSYALNDFDSDRSGDVFLIPKRNVLMHWDPVRGSGHGSHYGYDTHVPLIFWGKAFKNGKQDAAATPYDLAHTLADLLGISLDPKVAKAGTSRLPKP